MRDLSWSSNLHFAYSVYGIFWRRRYDHGLVTLSRTRCVMTPCASLTSFNWYNREDTLRFFFGHQVDLVDYSFGVHYQCLISCCCRWLRIHDIINIYIFFPGACRFFFFFLPSMIHIIMLDKCVLLISMSRLYLLGVNYVRKMTWIILHPTNGMNHWWSYPWKFQEITASIVSL